MLIYKVENRINGRCYVGQTIRTLGQRKRAHIGNALRQQGSMYVSRAIQKYGPDNFTWTTLHDDITTIENLNKLEIYYIGYYNTFENGYNLTLGGGGTIGWKHIDESKRKMSEAKKGKYNGKDHPMYGKHLSNKHKEKISVARKGKYIGKNHPGAQAISINNKHFDTRKEAAEFLGVSPATVRVRILHETKWLNYRYADK